jgi:polyphenol oxidase
LNLSYWVGDNPRSVDQNWQRARRLMPRGVLLAQLKQVHGNTIQVLGSRLEGDPRPDGDGMVTAIPGIALCIFTADCVPVLLVDSEAKVIGAAHAGWRGILAGIAGTVVEAMVRQGARREAIRVLLGPSIGACCYEVDAELADRFDRELRSAHAHIRSSGHAGKACLDLRGMAADELALAGLARDEIRQIGPCTRCASDNYFSRRSAHGAITGLQLSFIGLR